MLGLPPLSSFALAPRLREPTAFFRGWSESLGPPGLLTMVLSQVTTWIFARSLLTAAILGFYYGIAGALAYAAYYLSFFTGAAIIDHIRFRHQEASIQDFLRQRFGNGGVRCYNFVIGIRLLSEVFANLLVIGVIFGVAGSEAYIAAIVTLSAVTLAYSMMGGLQASLRTDVLQMVVFAVVLALIMVMLMRAQGWSAAAAITSGVSDFDAGWNLLVVALLQVWSYPMHDPVMMDRGFIADRATTRASFLHAGWISIICILAFAMLGVFAGLNALEGEKMMPALIRLLGEPTMTLMSLALIVSAVSTLDSTLSSAAKLCVIDMNWLSPTLRNGRLAMTFFMFGGLAFLFLGSKDLFDAVAVSGTASMFLTPVILFSVWGNRDIPSWSYYVAFAASILGASLYYGEASGGIALIEPIFGIGVKYNKLLLICVAVLGIGLTSFAVGCGSRAGKQNMRG
jgi:Na+/proline symporter